MKKRFRQPPLWVSCLIASLALHSLALYVVTRTPIATSKKSSSFFQNTKPLPLPISELSSLNELEDALESFFEEFAVTSPPTPAVQELAINTPPLLLETTDNELSIPKSEVGAIANTQIDAPSAPLDLPSIELNESIAFEGKSTPIAPSASCMKPDPVLATPGNVIAFDENSINPPLVEDKISSDPASTLAFGLPSRKAITKGLPSVGINTPPTLQQKPEDAPIEDVFQKSLEKERLSANFSEESKTKYKSNTASQTTLATKSFAQIDDYLPTESLFSLEWNGSFDIAPSFFPDGDGYVFSLKVTPKKELAEQKIKQTVLFLIDSSSTR